MLEYLFVLHYFLLTNNIVVWIYHICLSIHHLGCFYFFGYCEYAAMNICVLVFSFLKIFIYLFGCVGS